MKMYTTICSDPDWASEFQEYVQSVGMDDSGGRKRKPGFVELKPQELVVHFARVIVCIGMPDTG